MKLRKFVSILLIVFIFSCEKSENQKRNIGEDFEISEKVILINPTVNAKLINVENGNLLFAINTQFEKQPKVGDILVSGIHDKAPYGYLRKIESITYSNAGVSIQTSNAKLNEAIIYAQVEKQINSNREVAQFVDYEVSSVVYDNDGNYSTTLDQVKIVGLISINSDLGLLIDINNGNFEHFKISAELDSNFDLRLEAGGEVLDFYSQEFLLASQPLSPFTILVGGWFPIVVTPRIDYKIEASGSVNFAIDLSVERSDNFSAFVEYRDGNGFDVGHDHFGQTDFSFNATPTIEIEGAYKPNLLFSLYGINAFSAGFNNKPYVNYSLNLANSEWKLKTGLEVSTIVDLGEWGFNTYQNTIFDISVILDQGVLSFSTKPTLTTNPISGITQTSASSGGNISNDGGSIVFARGICWSTNPNPDVNNNSTNNGSGIGNFSSVITGLNNNTTYYVRAYATNEIGTAYGNQKTFTTNSNNTSSPTLTTNLITNITETSAASGGNITGNGGSNVTARGVCWNTSPNPDINDNVSNDGNGSGNFSSLITNLSPNTTYYVKAYATNSAGTNYGGQRTFTTESNNNSLPNVTTNSVTNITETSASSGGNVTNNGGNNVTDRGVCWSTNPNPSINDNVSNDGNGSGNFSSLITNLNPNTTYYVKAYATNNVGTNYGSQRTFTTDSNSSNQPNLVLSDFRIDNDDNNNEIVEAGEDIDLDIQVQNTGGAAANNVEVYFGTNDPDINITDHSQGYGNISQGSYDWNNGNLDFEVSADCPTKTVTFTATFTSDEGTWNDSFSINIQGSSGGNPITITPTNLCADAPTLDINTEYIVNLDLSSNNIGFAPPIDGVSFNGNDVQGFWLEFNEPNGFIGDIDIKIYDVSSNFDPVVGHKLSCGGIYYTQWNMNTFVANIGSYGDSETFADHSENNGYTHRIRIYHYNGNESPNISFKIKLEEQ